jgi:hypothetical protein
LHVFQAGGHAADGVELRLNMEIGEMGDTETPRRSGSDGGQRGKGRAGREAARKKCSAGDVHGPQYTGHLAIPAPIRAERKIGQVASRWRIFGRYR